MRNTPLLVSPSILAADFGCLNQEIARINDCADFLHFDVMDGHYVPNLSFGIPVLQSIRGNTKLPFDVHLMVTNPHDLIQPFSEAGADFITFHLETTDNPIETARMIRRLGRHPGVSIHPDTPTDRVFSVIPYVDLILVMSVYPGFGGQSFLQNAPERIRAIREELDRTGSGAHLSVDGGISEKTGRIASDAGADILVAGSFVFADENPADAVRRLKECGA